MNTEAVILAAGQGTRLGGEVNGDPKCLIPFGEKVLLEYQLDILESVGIERVVVVIGHEADRVRQIGGDRCTFVVNSLYEETNSLYSLWTAREHIKGSFMLLNSDVLAHAEMCKRVLEAGGAALAYDSSSGQDPEHMKVSFSGGRLRAISKTLTQTETDGENVGILHFDEQAASLLWAQADAIVKAGEMKCWAPAAVDRMAEHVAIQGVDVADLPWTEIDFPEDLAHARQTVWPAISGKSALKIKNGQPSELPRNGVRSLGLNPLDIPGIAPRAQAS